MDIEWHTIRAIAVSVAERDDCEILIDFIGSEATFGRLKERHPTLLADTLDLVIASGCRIKDFFVTNELACVAQKARLVSHAFQAGIGKDVKRVEFHAYLKDADSFTSPDSRQSLECTKGILTRACNLEFLSLKIEPQCDDAFYSMECMGMAKILACAAGLDRLKELQLHSLEVPRNDLMHILGLCSASLTTLLLNDVLLLGDEDPWPEVFQHLRRNLHLTSFELVQPCRGRSFGDVDWMTGLFHLVEGEDALHTTHFVDGVKDTETFLDNIIKRGLTYRSA